jgi:hypothetical protein
MFASNPWHYTLPQMLGFLFMKPIKELQAIASAPACTPLVLIRFLLTIINIPIGVIALSIRSFDIYLSHAMGERPAVDVVAEARIKHGRLGLEYLAQNDAAQSIKLTERIIKAWDSLSGAALS